MNREEARKLPTVVDLPTAGRLLGIRRRPPRDHQLRALALKFGNFGGDTSFLDAF